MYERKNAWEMPVAIDKYKEKRDYNLDDIYEHAHSELSLQQSKRDQIITIYLALCSFLLPFALGEALISFQVKGLIFLVLGIIGIFFALSVVRYREYKEVYWLCCQSITVLQSFKIEGIDKQTVQSVFYHCLHKKGKGYLREAKVGKKIKRGLFVKKNLFSSETLQFSIVSLMAAFISGLGAALACDFGVTVNAVIGAAVGLFVFFLLLMVYFRTCMSVYAALEQGDGSEEDLKARDQAFNKAFNKAWFLHFYYAPITEEKDEQKKAL